MLNRCAAADWFKADAESKESWSWATDMSKTERLAPEVNGSSWPAHPGLPLERKSRVGWPCPTVVQLQTGLKLLQNRRKAGHGQHADMSKTERLAREVNGSSWPAHHGLPLDLRQEFQGGLAMLNRCALYKIYKESQAPLEAPRKNRPTSEHDAKQEQCMVRANCSQAISCRGESGP